MSSLNFYFNTAINTTKFKRSFRFDWICNHDLARPHNRDVSKQVNLVRSMQQSLFDNFWLAHLNKKSNKRQNWNLCKCKTISKKSMAISSNLWRDINASLPWNDECVRLRLTTFQSQIKEYLADFTIESNNRF